MRGRRVLEAAAEHVHHVCAARAARPCVGATRATTTPVVKPHEFLSRNIVTCIVTLVHNCHFEL